MNKLAIIFYMSVLVFLMSPDLSVGAEITDITSVGGSTFTATDDDGNVISENHSTVHKAQMRAIEHLQENCSEPECTAFVEQNYKLQITAKGNKGRDVLISWEPPTAREDGKALTSDEIKGYWLVLRKDGEALVDQFIGSVLTYTFTAEKGSTYLVRVATVDSKDKKSELSEPHKLQLK